MQVSLNCKKRAIDLGSNYRATFPNRAFAPKSFTADVEIDALGNVTFTKEDDRRVIPINPKDVVDVRFFLDEDRPYAEIVRERSGSPMSFVYTPIEDNIELGQQGVFAFRESLDKIAGPAGTEVAEYIDPNPLGICPDGVDSMEELIAIREAELAGYANDADELDLSVLTDEEDGLVAAQAELADMIDESTGYLEELQRKIEDEKTRRIDEINSLVNGADMDEDFVLDDDAEGIEEYDEYDEYDEEDEPIDLAVEDVEDEVDDEGLDEIPEEDIPAIADLLDKIAGSDFHARDDISFRLSKLDAAAKKIGTSLDDYDDTLDAKRSEQAVYLNKLRDAGVLDGKGSTTVAGLVKMLQDQTDINDVLNEKFKKERVERRHCVEQLDVANKKIEEQADSLDEVRRRLRFSEEGRRKSEKFVADARSEIRRVLAESSQKVAAALDSVEQMKKDVDLKNIELEEARKTTNDAIAAKQAAEQAQEELNAKFVEEKENNERVVREFSRSLDTFTDDAAAKIKVQVERADTAERKYAEQTVKIAELESLLSTARSQVDDAEMERTQLNSELLGAQETYKDLVIEYETLKKAHDQRGTALDEVKEALAALQGDYSTLGDEFEQFKASAAAEYDGIVASMTSDYDALQASYDEQISLTAAAEAALAAAEDKIGGLSYDYHVLQGEYADQETKLSDSGSLLNETEASLISARAEIAQLNRDFDNMKSEYENKIASMIADRSALDVASDNLLGKIRSINSMDGSFGNRKRKLDAIESALGEFLRIYDTERAAAEEPAVIEDEVVEVYEVEEPVEIEGEDITEPIENVEEGYDVADMAEYADEQFDSFTIGTEPADVTEFEQVELDGIEDADALISRLEANAFGSDVPAFEEALDNIDVDAAVDEFAETVSDLGENLEETVEEFTDGIAEQTDFLSQEAEAAGDTFVEETGESDVVSVDQIVEAFEEASAEIGDKPVWE